MIALRATGLSPDALDSALAQARANDLDWRSGRVWAYVYPVEPELEAVQKRAYNAYLTENALDPTVFPSLKRFENEVVGACLSHLRAPESAVGAFTSGGTESCMLAVKAARDWARSRGIAEPEIVVPVTAHAAFAKAAHYFDVTMHLVEVNPETFQVAARDMRAKCNKNTCLLVASAPSYAHGVIDPIAELGALALELGLALHVDACIGGWLLPFFARLGREVPAFDFTVSGVTSISLDLHKYGFCPKGASVVLYREPGMRSHQAFACADWTGYSVVNLTIQSSKSGGPVAAAWATLNYLGDSGYLELARKMKEATDTLLLEIPRIDGLRVLGQPVMSLIAFESREANPFLLIDAMRERGWFMQPQFKTATGAENIHLTVTPRSLDHLPLFLSDLRAAVDVAKTRALGPMVQQLGPVLASLDPATLTDETLQAMLAMGGLGGSDLPAQMAEVNAILNELPKPVLEKLLKTFISGLLKPAMA